MKWLKIVILLFCITLIIIGFGFGYIYNNYKNGACIDRPLSYGVEQLNDINNENFTCSCTPKYGQVNPFYFNQDGIISVTNPDNLLIITP